MKLYAFFLTSGFCLAAAAAGAAERWQPVAGPLMTRWARDVSPDHVHPEYPRPQMVRKDWVNLNGLWEYDLNKLYAPPPVGKAFAGRILVPFAMESALSGVRKAVAPDQFLWYRRSFQVPAAWQSRRVLLHFGAVDWEATVFVNGKQLDTHRGGYDAFTLDITDALKPSGKQELMVRVFDATSKGQQPRGKQTFAPGGCAYSASSGIWQTVWLEPVPAAYIERLVMTPDVDGCRLRLVVEGNGTGADDTITAVACDGGMVIGQVTGGVGCELSLPLPKDRIKLWSPEQPTLYDLAVTLNRKTAVLDQVESYFGMRKVRRGQRRTRHAAHSAQ